MTNHPTAKKAKRAKSKRPAKVRVKVWPVFGWVDGDGELCRGAYGVPITVPQRMYESEHLAKRNRPMTLVDGLVNTDFAITPKARPRNGK